MFFWIAENPVSAILFFIALFCLVQSWLLKKDFFSPVNVYCFSQCLTLGIAYLKLDYAMTDFKLKTWLFWIGAMVCFCGGGLLVKLVAKSNGVSISIHKPVIQYGYNWKLHLLLSFGVFFIFLIGVFGIIKTAGNLLVFVDNPGQWMTKESKFGYFPILYSCSPIAVFLFALASFSRYNPIKKLRWIARFMAFFTIVFSFLAYPNRTSLFFSVGFIFLLYNYLHKRISALYLLLCIPVIIAFFIGISSIRDQYMGNLKSVSATQIAILPYRYIANNYWNLDYAINAPSDKEYHPHTYGIDFFSGVFEYTGISGNLKRSFRWDSPFQESVMKINNYNTISYLWELYKDWGVLGVFFIPLICSIALNLLYFRLTFPFSPRTIMYYVFFIYFVGWLFFSPSYKQGLYWLWIFIIYFVTTVCMKFLPLPANAPILDKINSEKQCEENVAT